MGLKSFLLLDLLISSTPRILAWNELNLWNRQEFLRSSLSTLLVPVAPATQTIDGNRVRTVDVGGGIDLMTKPNLSYPDIVFPPSMEGVWDCQRVVTAIEGDSFMGQTAWKALGANSKTSLKTNTLESYVTRFLPSEITDKTTSYTVLDRAYETASRSGTSKEVSWNIREPNRLSYVTNDQFPYTVKIDVVRRQVEIPNDQGFGFQELYRITDGPIIRAALVKRRYRRAFDEQNRRQVQGLEIMKTFRVLDGMAGTELPTSTIKSSILMTRPTAIDYLDVPSSAF